MLYSSKMIRPKQETLPRIMETVYVTWLILMSISLCSLMLVDEFLKANGQCNSNATNLTLAVAHDIKIFVTTFIYVLLYPLYIVKVIINCLIAHCYSTECSLVLCVGW